MAVKTEVVLDLTILPNVLLQQNGKEYENICSFPLTWVAVQKHFWTNKWSCTLDLTILPKI